MGVSLLVSSTRCIFLTNISIWCYCIFFIQIVERFNGRLPGYIGSGNDKFSFSHVDDVVEGHIAAMHKGRPGERYLLTGENASFRHVFDIAAIITETQKPMFNIPFLVLEAYGWVSVLFSRITGKLPLISPPVCSVVFEIAFYSYSVLVYQCSVDHIENSSWYSNVHSNAVLSYN